MSYTSIPTYLPDPFSQYTKNIVPLTGIEHIAETNVLGNPTQALSPVTLLAPIVISTGATGATLTASSTGPTWDTSATPVWYLPSADSLASAYGMTYPSTTYPPNGVSWRGGNSSNHQVRVNDVYGVPVVNLSQFPQIFVAGTGSTGAYASAAYPRGLKIVPAYYTAYAANSASANGTDFVHSTLYFQFKATPTGTYGFDGVPNNSARYLLY